MELGTFQVLIANRPDRGVGVVLGEGGGVVVAQWVRFSSVSLVFTSCHLLLRFGQDRRSIINMTFTLHMNMQRAQGRKGSKEGKEERLRIIT